MRLEFPGTGAPSIPDDRGLASAIGNANHRLLLLLALEATRGSPHPVLELGMGSGSTPQLHDYCAAEGRLLISCDLDADFARSFAHLESPLHAIRCGAWNRVPIDRPWSVALVDHAPPERRRVEVARLRHFAAILVLHDTEERSPRYGYDRIWHLFHYRVDLRVDGSDPDAQADASAVSNSIDVTAWVGARFPGYPHALSRGW